MEKEFNFDELAEQMKTKSNEELLAEINEMLECMTDRGALEYHRCFIEAWFAHYYPVTYQMYLKRKDKEK